MSKVKPRVLVDTFHLYNAITGTRTYTTELCKGLENLESPLCEFIFYPAWRKSDNSNFFKGRNSLFKKIIVHISYFGWKQVVLPYLILVKKADVILAADYMLPVIKFRAKGITVYHDTFYWELKKGYNPIWRWYFLKFLNLSLSKDSLIITTSQYSKSRIESVVRPEVPVVPLYQCPKEMTSILDNETKILNMLKGKSYFLHVGVFDKRKNISTLIKAYKFFKEQHPDSKEFLVLVGSRAVTYFHDSYSEVLDVIKSNNLVDQVILTGHVSNEELASIYKKATAYIFPSKEEGFGIPCLEAMRVEIPLIISDQKALLEITEGAALVFPVEDVKCLADRMYEVLDYNTREQLIEKGRKRLAHFSREKFAEGADYIIHDHFIKYESSPST